jgi:hypothetical protein
MKPRSVNPVVGLLNVKDKDDARLVTGVQILMQTLLEKNVVGDVAASDESCLGWINQEVKCLVKPANDDFLDDLVVAVEQGDGPVGGEVIFGEPLALVD